MHCVPVNVQLLKCSLQRNEFKTISIQPKQLAYKNFQFSLINPFVCITCTFHCSPVYIGSYTKEWVVTEIKSKEFFRTVFLPPFHGEDDKKQNKIVQWCWVQSLVM